MLAAPDIASLTTDGKFDMNSYVANTLDRLGLLETTHAENNSYSTRQNQDQDDDTTNDIIVLVNKCDLIKEKQVVDALMENSNLKICMTSCTDESGVADFLETLKERLGTL